jgi:tetratricopeptide (TPR) repeat protein
MAPLRSTHGLPTDWRSFPGIPVQLAIADHAGVCGQGTGDEAIAACNRVLALNPKDAVAYSNRGWAYDSKGDYDRAISDLDQAIQHDPRLANAYGYRGSSSQTIGAIKATSSTSYPEAGFLIEHEDGTRTELSAGKSWHAPDDARSPHRVLCEAGATVFILD